MFCIYLDIQQITKAVFVVFQFALDHNVFALQANSRCLLLYSSCLQVVQLGGKYTNLCVHYNVKLCALFRESPTIDLILNKNMKIKIKVRVILITLKLCNFRIIKKKKLFDKLLVQNK